MTMTSGNAWSVEKTPLNIAIQQKVIDDGWRRWIAENLILGHPPDSIIKRMLEGGCEKAVAEREVMNAVQHPYLQAGLSFGRKIRKRDWILDNYRLLDQDSPTFGVVERKYKLSREDFLRDYYSTNRPVIIQGAMDHWAAMSKWTPDWLKHNFGERIIEVQANRNADRLYEINMEQHRKQILLRDFVELITDNQTNDVYMTANNGSRNIDQLPEYLDGTSDRKGFLWFGPAGTITPLHHDLTNNFMAQVCGRKLIKLIPAYYMPYVYNHLHCYSEVDLGNIDYERYPLLKKVKIIELILEPGEVLFLPVGCWHYVQGLEISMTMTFTNFLFKNDFSSNYTTYNEI